MQSLTLRLTLTLLFVLPIVSGWGPCGPITGGRIAGELATELVNDWTFTDDISTIQIETRPDDPYSVTTWCFTDGPHLYIPSRGAPTKPWVKNVLADPRVRLRIGGKVYAMRATRVTDDGQRGKLIALLKKKYVTARWGMDDDPEASPDTWFFHVEQEQF